MWFRLGRQTDQSLMSSTIRSTSSGRDATVAKLARSHEIHKGIVSDNTDAPVRSAVFLTRVAFLPAGFPSWQTQQAF
jgi:hypothetical protein